MTIPKHGKKLLSAVRGQCVPWLVGSVLMLALAIVSFLQKNILTTMVHLYAAGVIFVWFCELRFRDNHDDDPNSNN